MNSPVDPKNELNDCGCCEGVTAETPAQIGNRPGLSAIAYRIGTHAQFRETLQARLSGSQQPALSALTTREASDFSIALLDSWATVADVLTFYQERIANEAYLRTATERLSVLELARLIGYQLRPGVAASTYLAFTLETAPGALGQALGVGTTAQIAPETLPPITIFVGTKVQSIPGPGEQAQTFETVQEIEARPEWNAIKPRLTQPQPISLQLETVFLAGTTANLKQGDRLLIVDDSGQSDSKTVFKVTIDDDTKNTRVDFVSAPAALPGYSRPSLKTGVFRDFLRRIELNDFATQQINQAIWLEEDLSALATIQRWNVRALVNNISRHPSEPSLLGKAGVFVFRQHAAIFGSNAPKQPTYKGTVPNPPSEWVDWPRDASEAETLVFLDNAYNEVLSGSYATIEKPGHKSKTYQIEQASTRPRTAYGISSKTTLLTLANGKTWWPDFFSEAPALADFRDVVIHAQSEQLPLSEMPIVDLVTPQSVSADGITLDGVFLGLKIGQRVILTGERDDLKGVIGSETLTLKTVILEAGFTVVTFDQTLAYSYVRKTVIINANVALATHGESVLETLGGGDATQAFQRFTLRQPPLTYVSSSDPSGALTTLEVRVNDILWHEVPDFFGHEPEERIYVTRLDDEGKTTVIFGDGKTGARLPTGQENIRAKYRKGIGLGGLVKANQITQLLTRPLGVKDVTNPTAPDGAADAEKLDEARSNAPLTVLTLGRTVSLRDYEDFARAFSGITKALATWTWFGEKRGVFVTVAGSQGAEVKDDSQLYLHLLRAIQAAGDPQVQVVVKSYQPRVFRLVGAVKIAADFLPEKVLAEVDRKLRDTFSFAARAFGQPVHLSELIGAMQSVRGTLAVNVTELHRSDESVDLKDHVAAAVPQAGADDEILPAELLTLDPRPLVLGVFE
jgi:hypothetical protein